MIIAFDLETTGLDKINDSIIEVALIKFDEKTYEVIDTYSTFVNPEREIPDLISNITNIFDEDVLNSPTIGDIRNELIDFIGDYPLLGHNVDFDCGFFETNGISTKNNVRIDTFFLANMLCRDAKSLNLEMLSKYFGLPFSGAHRAINDVKATINLFRELINKFNNLNSNNKKLIKFLFNKSDDPRIRFIDEFIYGENEEAIDFSEFENIILDYVGEKKQIREIIIDKKVDLKNVNKFYKKLGNVEKRENQEKMTSIVLDTIKKGEKSVIEAPTGLGKSFAYLIPSILYSVKTGEKIFVSTKTKALQNQLIEKDLDFLGKNLGIDFNYSKLKGKSNYISMQAFFNNITFEVLDYNKIAFLSKLSLWLEETIDGELDELNFFGIEFSYLKLINSDSIFVLRDDNVYKNFEYLIKARQDLESSNVIIINHSLLFSDLKLENSILGKIENLIVDEAHNIEDSVTESLRKKINEVSFKDFLDSIEQIFTTKNLKKVKFLVLKEKLLSHFDLLMDYSSSYLNTKTNTEFNYKNSLISEDFFEEIDFSILKSKIEKCFIDLNDILADVEEYDFSKEILFLMSNLEIVNTILDKKVNDNFIKIISFSERFGISLEYTLLNPGEYLEENLWTKLNSVVLTSATLKISSSFDYFTNILNLNKFKFSSFNSDFDYKKQSTLFIPDDLGSIKNNSNNIVLFLEKFYLITRGQILTLLTSFSIIKKIYTSLNQKLKKNDIKLYAQSIGGSKNKILDFYLEDSENSIILGTDSFWEGIDIPGDSLKYLIIHKFPFSVPNDPIFLARSKFFKDSFKDYAIPKSIIKLKQGFGRLIRSKNDKGIVVLLDDRIYSTQWGQAFMDAFPEEINVKKGKSDKFLEILEKNTKK